MYLRTRESDSNYELTFYLTLGLAVWDTLVIGFSFVPLTNYYENANKPRKCFNSQGKVYDCSQNANEPDYYYETPQEYD